MAVGESGLQIYLQPALHQGRLPDLAPAQPGTPTGRRATKSPVIHIWPFLFGVGLLRIMVDLGEGVKLIYSGSVELDGIGDNFAFWDPDLLIEVTVMWGSDNLGF